MLYEADGKVNGIKCYYKGKSSSKGKNLKLSKDDKLHFYKCMEIALRDTAIHFSCCNDFVHSFNRIVFALNKEQHFVKGSFTSDCSGKLNESNMGVLYSFYKRFSAPVRVRTHPHKAEVLHE